MVAQKHIRWTFMCAIAVLLSGCMREEGSTKPESQRAAGPFGPRFDAAMQIASQSARDEAISAVATDAGLAGDGEMVIRAVRNIAATSLRDATASKAALNLAKAGQREVANAVTMSIMGSELRDDTLKRLAKDE